MYSVSIMKQDYRKSIEVSKTGLKVSIQVFLGGTCYTCFSGGSDPTSLAGGECLDIFFWRKVYIQVFLGGVNTFVLREVSLQVFLWESVLTCFFGRIMSIKGFLGVNVYTFFC